MKKQSLVLTSLITIMAATMSYSTPLAIVPVPAVVPDATIPWVSGSSVTWAQGEPTFAISDPTAQLSAKGWLATNDDALLVKLEVHEKVHVNDQSGDRIWNGDFVRISLDGYGDGPMGGPRDLAGIFGPDDSSIGFALTSNGPVGFTYLSGDSKNEGLYPTELLNFSRDAAAGITHYSIQIPWSRLGGYPGSFPNFGIVVQVRSVEYTDQKDATHILWGDGANEPKPGLFKKVALANPGHAIACATPFNSEIWESSDKAEIDVAVAGKDDVEIETRAGADTQTTVIKGDASQGIRHFAITYQPSGLAGDKLAVIIRKAGTDTMLAQASTPVIVADDVVAELVSVLDDLIAKGGHPLFLRHLRSVKAMVQTEWARASVYKKSNTALARETLGYIQSTLRGFKEGSSDWNSYAREGRPLFMSFISPRDGTLQYYTLFLPKGWDSTKSRDEQPLFPLYFELHGAGNPHYLIDISAQLGSNNKTLDRLGYEGPRSYAMEARLGYVVAPYGRGNSRYQDIGETDIWEAYADAQKTVRIDPDRRYLFGFSMGGYGTWNLGSRTPDRWAAICILGMGAVVGDWGQGSNVNYLPIMIWGGEEDNIAYRQGKPVDMIARFTKAISEAGGSVLASTTPGIGHNYTKEIQTRTVNWLKEHTRKRPDTFSFIADTNEHRGVWGITMTRDMIVSPFPKFNCTIEGQVVRITTQGTNQIEVNTGPEGLNLTGTITLYLNNKQVYQGPANMPAPQVFDTSPSSQVTAPDTDED